MKKIISIVLCIAMIISTFAIAGVSNVFATEVDDISDVATLAANGNGEYTPVVFLPGIGQSQTYAYDADGNVITDWNLIGVNLDLSSAENIFTLLKAALPLIGTLIVGKNLVSDAALADLVDMLFEYCKLDANGKPPANVETPNFRTNLGNYEKMYGEKGKEGRDIFLNRIPCQELVDIIGEENVYCYNYSAFSYTLNEADGLDDFITNVVKKETGADKVILVPMSMGATVTSAYLARHGHKQDVEKVISIVGAWNGSDVFADLLELKYTDKAPDLLYNGIIADLVGDPYGNLINVALRLFPKPVLREFIDQALTAVIENLICTTTSFFSLVPYERYDAIAEKYLTGDDMKTIKAQCDEYHKIQGNIKNTLYNCRDNYGVEFYFICGYDMGFGEETGDFAFFQFFESASTTNSDEIIQISSTGVGITAAPAGKELPLDYKAVNPVCTDKSHNHISPNKSIDVSTSLFPETTWCFVDQTHELTWNDTALDLCYAIVFNEVKNIHNDKYPQFNESRDIKDLKRDYIPDAKALLNGEYEGLTLTAEQATKLSQLVADAEAMMNRTINDRDEDDKIIKALRDYMVEIGRYEADSEPSTTDKALNFIFGGINDIVYAIVGPRGFSDLYNEFLSNLKK
ncbi:MAG: alpha/beta hydrolase [Ruminococcaceae bacterium]|nr:alpha/beta hydrolase [Oscillospiraceae bacterium]